MKFNCVEITDDTVLLTRQHFADNQQACIDEVKNGAVRANNPEQYFRNCTKHAAEFLAGEYDHTFTFLQRAYWLQTGESVALLP